MTAAIDASAGAQALHVPALLITLAAGLASGLLRGPATRPWLRLPWMTLTMASVVGAAFALQRAVPSLLALLARKPEMLLAGQVWRAISALFVQDGDTTGVVFNLTILLLLGTVAERQLGPTRWLAIYFGGGVISEFPALAWQPYGAGNSIACFALAGAMALRGARRTAGIVQLGASAVGMGASLALLLMHDIHGLGFWAGAAVDGLLPLRSRVTLSDFGSDDFRDRRA